MIFLSCGSENFAELSVAPEDLLLNTHLRGTGMFFCVCVFVCGIVLGGIMFEVLFVRCRGPPNGKVLTLPFLMNPLPSSHPTPGPFPTRTQEPTRQESG